MPIVSVWLIRTALLHFTVGIALGAVLLVQKPIPFWPALWLWLPAHVEILVFGWIIQLVIGVGYWMLPKYPVAPIRGHAGPLWAAWGLLNGGVLLAVAVGALGGYALPLLAARLMELGAVVLFARNVWPRIKPFGEGQPTG